MALPGKPLGEILALDRAGLEDYFESHARYFGDAPRGLSGKRYGIRFGSATLLSDDTYELKKFFIRAVGIARAKQTRKERKRGK